MLEIKDFQLLDKKGITYEDFELKLKNFENGFPKIDIHRPAIIGDGVLAMDDSDYWIKLYEDALPKTDIVKFVPASGAASRMFKDLFQFLGNKDTQKIIPFVEGINKYPFYNDLKKVLSKNDFDLEGLIKNQKFDVIVNFLINEKGLNYGNLPKGLLKFHTYPSFERIAIEEQIVEGIDYAKGKNNVVNLHFTVSQNHLDLFKNKLKVFKVKYEKEFGVEINFDLSIQKPSTDIVAVDSNNEPIRTNDGNLMFAPAGHGALIENLNEINTDIVFLKNIDNVVPDWYRKDTIIYKKVIGGFLTDLQKKIFSILESLKNENQTKDSLKKIVLFAEKYLNIYFSKDLLSGDLQNVKGLIFNKLNRPIRICGMVENTGEPGGGPFWVKDKDGELSLQILEKAQFDLEDPMQVKILQSSTHFNPVDLVCSIRDFEGNKFDLKNFTDPEMGFISEKVYGGKPVKIQELPGLWNGAMANWITLFVEVPLSTFNPIKNHLDWLRKEHQQEV